MKITSLFIASGLLATGLVACQKKENSVREEASDKVGDALNTRDHEKLRDSAEDLEKDMKKVGEGLGESLKEAGEKIEKEAEKTADEINK